MQSSRVSCSLLWIFWIFWKLLPLVSFLPTASSLTSQSGCLHFELEHGWTCRSITTTSQDSVTLMQSIPLQSENEVNAFFASKSQAKRACRNGGLWILQRTDELDQSSQVADATTTDLKHSVHLSYSALMESPLVQAHPSTMLNPGDQVWIMANRHFGSDDEATASWNGYPVSVTKQWLPPPQTYQRLLRGSSISEWVVYEDEEIAVILKPDNLTTISKTSKKENGIIREEDLQSLLPFILQCPMPTKQSKNNYMYLPRPVHRLDKQTSGLVLVAKSARAMKFLSKAFANRQVTKTYSAVVVLNAKEEAVVKEATTTDGLLHSSKQQEWQTIDYPINGKSAVSSWRMIRHSKTTEMSGDDSTMTIAHHQNPSNTTITLALLQIRPHTGRTHQIRRHLAYNLKSPIVGDSKYCYYAAASSSDKTLDWHQNQARMYLHCHELEFPYPWPGQVDKNDDSDKSPSSSSSTIATSKHAIITRMSFSSATNEEKEEDPQRSEEVRMRISIPLPISFDERVSNHHRPY